MSVEVRHGEAAVGVDADNRPAVPVADGFAAVGPVVTAGDHDVADRRCLISCDVDRVLTEVTAKATLLLDREVERVDVLVRLGDEGHARGATPG